MNSLVKTAVAGALALGATSAFAVGLPSTNNSDLILYVDALTSSGTSAGVYAVDTNISLSSLMPGGFVTGAANNKTAFAGTSATVTTAGLSSFIASKTGAGDSIAWTVEGGQFDGSTSATATNFNSVNPGSALAIFASPSLTAALPNASTATTGTMYSFLNGLQKDLTIGGLTGLKTASETTGTEQSSPPAPSKYGFFGGPDLATTGSSAIDLFGFTGGGVNGGTLQSYILGNATLSAAGVLQINPNSASAVPLPAAVWLFGSGLMGLVGVSRRRKSRDSGLNDSVDHKSLKRI
jgi:hypothetical protein